MLRRQMDSAVGRPSLYSAEVTAEICARIAGGEALSAICREDSAPHLATVYRWLQQHEEFRELYARAREDQADTLFDEVLEIADDARNDWMERHGEEDAGWVANGEHIQRSRLRVDARKWIAGRLKPKKYGDTTNVSADGKIIVEIKPFGGSDETVSG